MERKIGEIFECNGEWYQCVETSYDEHSCLGCDGCWIEGGLCNAHVREDDKYVIFKKLEKVGEPYIVENSVVSGRPFQKYRLYEQYFTLNEKNLLFTSYGNIVSIEIKQNKEDMEEKKLNLKPFDIQKAREGKPVCTRDGRRARIICFDRNDLYPIVALIECEDGKEIVGAYSNEGHTEIYEIKGTDLMMLPEKHEGWVNIAMDTAGDDRVVLGRMYNSREDAMDEGKRNSRYVTTIKIEWEE